MRTTVGQIIVNDALPVEYRDYNRVMGKDESDAVLAKIATDMPDQYNKVSHALMEIGRNAAFDEGMTLTLADLTSPVDRTQYFDLISKKEDEIDDLEDASPAEKNELKAALFSGVADMITDDTFNKGLEGNNPFALQVKSKARGSKGQLAALLSTPGTYSDHNGNMIPIFIKHSYAEGLDPEEYWSAAYGGRLGVLSTKTGTAKGGHMGKLLSVASLSTVVTAEDCGTPNGYPVKTDDMDNIGAVLARQAGPFSPGTVITKDVISALKKKGIDEIATRSVLTCAQSKGVCQKCAGKREFGDFPELGYNLGQVASSALAEPLAQQALNCLVADTKVLMADWSSKPIQEIAVNDLVMGCSVAGEMTPVKVTATFDNGVKDCVQTTFVKNGCHHKLEPVTVGSTSDHKFRSTRRVSSQKDAVLNFKPRILPIGTVSKYFYCMPPSHYTGSGVTEPLSLLIGTLLGDGCYTRPVTGVHVSCADVSQIQAMQDNVAKLGIRITKLAGHDYYYRVSADLRRNPVKQWLREQGCYGKYAHEKTIPDIVNSWDNESVANLIAGLLITDGSVYDSGNGKPGISLSSSSRPLLESVIKLLMFRFGILTSCVTMTGKTGVPIRETEFGSKYVRKHQQYQFTITSLQSVEKIAREIPLFGVKLGRLQELLSNYKPKTSPYSTQNFSAFKRVSQVKLGLCRTYDIEVEHPDHLFVLANGLVCSNSKHSGKKAAGAGFFGFDVIKNLATSPETYPDRAAISEVDGIVESIEPAPQGGTNITINGETHYALPGMDVYVKPGDSVGVGDPLSNGVVNPADVVRLKGLGEGRKYFADRFTQAFRDSGLGVNRRNVEAVSRAIVNHVEVNDEDAEGDGLPGDIVTYSHWASTYKPRPDSAYGAASKAVNQYLEEPYLHYSIGTKVTKPISDKLAKFGYDSILTNPKPVGVSPKFISLVRTPEYGDDWMARLGSSYLDSRLLKDVQTGAESDVHGLDPLPGLAKTTEFGQPPKNSVGPY